jgi:CubicO group peptidase (beta-lactamase class C family)
LTRMPAAAEVESLPPLYDTIDLMTVQQQSITRRISGMSITAGLSKSRLQRMHDVLSRYIERKDLPGLVALVSRNEEVHVETPGTMSIGDPAPMKRDSIFRIASITKPITAVAAMARRCLRKRLARNAGCRILVHYLGWRSRASVGCIT